MKEIFLTKQEIIDANQYIFDQLNKREQDIISRRFGLLKSESETLERIGKDHNLTRERVRQLEVATIKKIRQLKDLEGKIKNIKSVILGIVEEYGGLVGKDYLFTNLLALVSQDDKIINEKSIFENNDVYQNNIYFYISKIFDELEEINISSELNSYFKEKNSSINHFEELISELSALIKEERKVFTTNKIINFFSKLENYKKYQDEFTVLNKVDLEKVFNYLFKEDSKFLLENKIFYSILQAARHISQSKLGYWGISNWSEIKPKTISEKIYLVLRENKSPMHFREIAEKINKIGFDHKLANPATVHNELILGDRYILIGRGIYTLGEWGYKPGTVTNIINDILSDNNKPMHKDDIINNVLKQRLIKKNTILLALSDGEKFKKQGDFYQLV